jgi:glycosyltransferase involved in cell wall biosynthesis
MTSGTGIRVLELRSAVGPGGGPEKTILLGARDRPDSDITTTVCYIRDLRDLSHDLHNRAAALGVHYVELHEANSFDLFAIKRLVHLVRRERFSILHAHDYKTDLFALIVARLTHAVPFATAHGWTGHTRRERALYYPADKRLLARYPRVVAVSTEIRHELVRTGSRPQAVVVVLNGIDASHLKRSRERESDIRASLGIGPRDFVIGSVGRLEPQKRFDVLIDAVATVSHHRPEARLIIAGDGSMRQELMTRARAAGLGDRCTLLGHRSDIVELHHAFDLFAQSSDYEGTPNAVLEALAMETPVVATDAGGTAELVTDGVEGRVVPRGSSELLARAIVELMQSPIARAGYAVAGRQRVETALSFAARTDKVHQLYRDVLDERTGRYRHA